MEAHAISPAAGCSNDRPAPRQAQHRLQLTLLASDYEIRDGFPHPSPAQTPDSTAHSLLCKLAKSLSLRVLICAMGIRASDLTMVSWRVNKIMCLKHSP